MADPLVILLESRSSQEVVKRGQNQVQVLTTAVTEMAKAMATPRASPATTTSNPVAGISPGKVRN